MILFFLNFNFDLGIQYFVSKPTSLELDSCVLSMLSWFSAVYIRKYRCKDARVFLMLSYGISISVAENCKQVIHVILFRKINLTDISEFKKIGRHVRKNHRDLILANTWNSGFFNDNQMFCTVL